MPMVLVTVSEGKHQRKSHCNCIRFRKVAINETLVLNVSGDFIFHLDYVLISMRS